MELSEQAAQELAEGSTAISRVAGLEARVAELEARDHQLEADKVKAEDVCARRSVVRSRSDICRVLCAPFCL